MSSEAGLRKVLGSAGLTSLGIGGTIGTGIFVMVGTAARDVAGPAIIVSFLVAALACGCAALCYARLAARYPEAGSAYAYARALTSPLVAFLVGWNLMLQYILAAASIAQGWAHYLQDSLLGLTGITLPALPVNLPAFLVVVVLSFLLLLGIRISAGVNHAIVAIKLAVIALVLVVGARYLNPAHWAPFAPFGWGGFSLPFVGSGGPPKGMLAGAGIVFYAFLGFEALTNYSEETKIPHRDIPRSIVLSLGICTLLYMGMSTVLTGMVPYQTLSKDAPVSAAFGQLGMPWLRSLVGIGALIGITSVLLVILLSLPRVLMAISRENILPANFLSWINTKGVPVVATIAGGTLVALLTAFVPLDMLGIAAVMANIVTFLVVATLAMQLPKADRFTPIVTCLLCGILLFSLPWFGWIILGIWWVLGGGFYALRRKSTNVSTQ